MRRDWISDTLGSLVSVTGGGTPSRSVADYWNGLVPWATVKDFKDVELSATEETITQAGVENSATNVVDPGSIIVPTRIALGKVAINTIPLAINQDLKALRTNGRVDTRYLLHFLLTQAPRVEARGVGSTVKGITLDVLREIQVPFPRDLNEQRRIAAILDKADVIRRKRHQALAETDALLRAAYLQLVGLRNPDHNLWPVLRIEELAAQHRNAMRTGPFGSDLLHSEFVDHGIAVLGIDNAVQNRFAWDERRFITPEKYEKLQRYRVFPGDVIVTIMGTTGRSTVVPDDIPEAITTKHLATITPDRTRVHPAFLSFAIHSDPLIIRQIAKANKGAIMAGLNLGIIKALEIPLPPLHLQQRFAACLSKIHKRQDNLASPELSGEYLFSSLSQRAFRGEL